MAYDQARALYAEIGRRIRRAREQQKLSQGRLAGLVGLSRISIVNVEQGKQRPPVHAIYHIAGVLGVDPHDLLPQLPPAPSGAAAPHPKITSEIQAYYESLVAEPVPQEVGHGLARNPSKGRKGTGRRGGGAASSSR